MAAIITETFRRNNTTALLNDIADVANRYYIGIGKSDAWPAQGSLTEDDSDFEVVEPLGTFGDNVEIFNNLTTLIGITTGTYTAAIPNIAAKVNHRHKAYNPFDPDCFYQTVQEGIQMYPCYVVVSNNVYLCLREATDIEATYSLPTGASQSRAPIENADGSVWLYIYTVQPSYPIRGSQFISVPDTHTLNGVETGATITAASGELVYGFTVIDGGSGYVTAPVVEYVTEAGVVTTLEATVAGGAITSVAYPSATSVLSWVKDRGYVRIASGNAIVKANIGPKLGFGYTPTNDLPSWYIGIAIEAVEAIYGDGAYIPYRQVTIVKNPEYEVGTLDPALSINCLQHLDFGLSDAPTTVTTGALITQPSTGARGIADYYDTTNKYLYYHQDSKTGFVPFNASSVSVDASLYDPTGFTTSEYKKQTGDVIFAENRKKISRVGGQTEEITIILQF
jgi:hypothetical protein